MGNWVVICGLVRDREAFEKKIEGLAEWKREGLIEEILYSTWLGEIDKYDRLAAYLSGKGVIVIESEEPPLIVNGHRIHQLKALAFGVDACPEDAYVLKMRPDMIPNFPGLYEVLREKPDLTFDKDCGLPVVFTERLLVQNLMPIQPFFLNDIVFYGRKEDVQKLLRFSVEPEVLSLIMNAEQAIHFSPFRSCFPGFLEFFRVNPGPIYHDIGQAGAVAEFCFSNQFYLETLSAWFYIIQKYYKVGFFKRGDGHDEGIAGDLRSLHLFDLFDPRVKEGPHWRFVAEQANAVTIADDAWIAPCLSGKLLPDSCLERFMSAVSRIHDVLRRHDRSPLFLSEEAIAFGRELKGRFPYIAYESADLCPRPAGSIKMRGRRFEAKVSEELPPADAS